MSIPFTPIPLTAPVPVDVANMIATINHLVNEVNVKLADIAASAGGGALTAGVGISIAANVISTDLTAGTGISISGATITNTQSGGGVTFPLYGTPDATIKGLHSLTTASGGQIVMLGGDSSSGPGGGVSIQGGIGGAAYAGGTLNFIAGAQGGSGGGGGVNIAGGLGAGNVHIDGGAGNGALPGGNVRILGGAGNNAAGAGTVVIGGGVAHSGAGTNVSIYGGIIYAPGLTAAQVVVIGGAAPSGFGGDVSLAGGPGISRAGNVVITNFANAPVTAVAGGATVNAQAGVVTSEALVGAVAYTLTLVNSRVVANSVVLVTATNSANLPVTVNTVTPSTNSITIVVGMAALTGTVKIAFAVFN